MTTKKCTPEYETLKEYLPKICDALSHAHDSITPLANDFCAAQIIPLSTKVAVTNSTASPVERSNDLMTAAMGTVKYDPSKFEPLLEKLSDHDLEKIAKEMDSRCEALGKQGTPEAKKGKSSREPMQIDKALKGRKILVVGHNGSGKSSLINELLAQKSAHVGQIHTQTKHKPIEEYTCTVDGIEVTILDTRGFGDPEVKNEDTMNAIIKTKEVDVVLICHKLYNRLDRHTTEELQMIVKAMGNDLIDISVLVFTFGDEYKVRHNPQFNDGFCRNLTEKSKAEIKIKMTRQRVEMEHHFKEAFKNCSIKKEIAGKIPSCVSCGKRNDDGTEIELPTSDNWIVDLWKLCADQCPTEAKPFVHNIRKKVLNFIVTGAFNAVGAYALHSAFTSPNSSPFILAAAAVLKTLYDSTGN